MHRGVRVLVVLAGAGLAAACNRGGGPQEAQQRVGEAQEQVRQAEQELQQTRERVAQQAREDPPAERGDLQGELAESQQQVQDAERGLAEARRAQPGAEPPSGDAPQGAHAVQGRVESASADTVVLRVPDEGNRQLRLRADAQVSVRRGDQPATLVDLQPGDEVRASYELRQDGQPVLRSVIIEE